MPKSQNIAPYQASTTQFVKKATPKKKIPEGLFWLYNTFKKWSISFMKITLTSQQQLQWHSILFCLWPGQVSILARSQNKRVTQLLPTALTKALKRLEFLIFNLFGPCFFKDKRNFFSHIISEIVICPKSYFSVFSSLVSH